MGIKLAESKWNRLPAATIALCVLIIGIAAWFYYLAEARDVTQKAETALSAVADLKVAQIVNWRNERLGDGRFFSKAPFVAKDIQRLQSDPQNPAIRSEILTWLTLLKSGNRYETVAIFDTNYAPLLSVPDRNAPVGRSMRTHLAAALATNDVVMSDLHRGSNASNIHIEITFPVFAPSAPGSSPSNASPLGVVLLRLDPKRFLYPLVNSQSIPSPSAEAVLGRHENGKVLILNNLRHRTNTALNLSLPLDSPGRPAAQAIRAGKGGVFEGRDYRGVPVLTVFRFIPDSPWWLGVKVDRAEVLAPAQAETLRLTLSALALVFAVVGGLSWLSKQRSLEHARRELALAVRIAFLSKNTNDILVLADQDLRIIDTNERAAAAYGYAAEELTRLTLRDLRAPESKARFDQDIERLNRERSVVYEVTHCRKDGSTFPVETSARVLEMDGKKYYQLVNRDITERQKMEDTLARERALLRTMIDQIPDPIFVKDRESRFLLANEAVARLMHTASPAELLGRTDADFYSAERAQEFRADEQRVLAGEPQYNKEETIHFPGGNQCFVLITKLPFRDHDGQVVGLVGIGRDITDRTAVEAALRDSENQFRAMFELASIGMAQADPRTGRWLRVNQKLSAITGYSVNEMLQMRVPEITHPDDQQKDWALFQRVVRGETPDYRLQKRYVRKDGVIVWVNVNMTVIRDASGQPIRTAATIEDITERKRAEAERETLDRQRTLALNAARLGWWHYDPMTRIITWDDRFSEIFGVSGHRCTIEEILAPLHPGDMPRVWAAVEAALNPADPQPYAAEYRVCHPDGSVRWVQAHGLAEFAGEGEARRAVSFVGTVADITERKRADVVLRESLLFRREAENLARIGAWKVNPQTDYLYWTEGVYEILEAPLDYKPGLEEGLKFYHADSIPVLREALKRALEDGTPFVVETRLTTMTGKQLWTEVRGLGRVEEGEQAFVMGTFQDITERKRAEEAVRELNQNLEQRVRERTAQLELANKELEAFSYSVSHDLRAPLRAIDGFARILAEDYLARLDEEGRRVLGIICAEAKRMGQLIDDLLAFSRMNRRPMQPREIDMTALVTAAFEECAAQAPGRPPRFNPQPLPPALGDPSLLRQVWVNLLSNAIKYSRSKDPAEIEVGGRVEDSVNIYYVKDNGVGFDMKYAGKLFGVFQRLHGENEFEGTGVGLALVQRVIERHGGRVWAEASLNQGATFSFTLPRREPESEPEPQP